MLQLLDDVRSGRDRTVMETQTEAKHNEELRHVREVARLRAFKKGLPPPGADVKMLQRVEEHPPRRPRPSLMARPMLQNHRCPHIMDRTKKSNKKSEAPKTTETIPDMDPSVVDYVVGLEKGTPAENGQNVLDALVDVLFDRSADIAAPHLAPAATHPFTDKDFHPRGAFARCKVAK